MTTVSHNKALVARLNKEVHEGRKIEVLYELLSPDFINHNAPPGNQGVEDTLHFYQQVLWPALSNLRVEIIDQIAEGDRVVTRKILHAVQQKDFMGIGASNAVVQIKVIDIFRIADGKLSEHWGMLDLHDLQQQAGQAK